MYAIPLLLAACGLALIIAAMRRDTEPRPVKLLAAATLFIVLLAFVSMLLPPKSEVGMSLTATDLGGGGYLGALASVLLQGSFGRLGAYVAILLLSVIALCVLLEGISRGGHGGRREDLAILERLVSDPLQPAGEERPVRIASRIRSAVLPPQVMPPSPQISRPGTRGCIFGSASIHAELASRVRQHGDLTWPTPDRPGKVTLVPRIIGSAQVWQLPAIEEIPGNQHGT